MNIVTRGAPPRGIVVVWFVCLSVCLFVISELAHLDAIALRLQQRYK